MKNIYKVSLLTLFVAVFCLSQETAVLAVNSPQIQTSSATNVQNNSVVLNGYLSDMGGYSNTTVWLQYGLSASYGFETSHITQSNTGLFSQTISGLAPNTTFHFRAAAQNSYGTSYGSDMTFMTGQSGGSSQIIVNAGADLYVASGQTATLQGSGYDTNGYSVTYSWNCNGGTLSSYNILQPVYRAPYNSSQTSYVCTLTVTNNYGATNSDSAIIYVNSNSGNYGSLLVSKKVINLSSGNLNWSTSVSANPSDILSFATTIQASSNRDIHNVIVRDSLPSGLIYKNNLTVNTSVNYSGDITSGVNIGTIYAGQTIVVAYQAQVSPYQNFNYGTTTLTNNISVSSNETGISTSSAMVFITRSSVSGASNISTGLTNNFLTDSFLLPLLLILAGIWLYKSGIARGLLAK